VIVRAPRQILAALERVRAMHPYAPSGAIAPSERVETEVGHLWSTLLETAPEAVETRIAGLSDMQVLLMLYGAPRRLERSECRFILDRLFAQRKPAGHDLLAWEGIVLGNGGEGFRAAALRCAAEVQSAAGVAVARAALPFDECIGRYRRSGTTFEEWLDEFRGLIDEKGLLARTLRRRLLAEVATSPLREDELTICRWLTDCYVESERSEWFGAFLRRTATQGWNARSPLMIALVGRFGAPRRHEPFWARLGEAVCSAVQRWILDRQLANFLEGERLAFWRNYLQPMTEIYPLGKEAIVVGFPHAIAIQFKEMGRATYLFPRRLLTRFRAYEGMRSYQIAALYQEVLKANRDGKTLGRYEHRGYYWQESASYEVDRVLDESGNA
jgi:hypothetical protein